MCRFGGSGGGGSTAVSVAGSVAVNTITGSTTSALSYGSTVIDSGDARALIRSRELRLKGPRSRFSNRRALDQWSGYAGLFRMSYRWPTVRQFLGDLHDGLNEGKA